AGFARAAGEPNTPDPIAPAVPDDGQDAGVAPAALPPWVDDRPLEPSRFRLPTDRSRDETVAPRIFRRAQRGACALARSRPVDVGALMPHTLKDVLPATARLRDDGHLEVGGCDLVSLAAEHGTPMYVFCTETFRRQARRYRAAFPTPDRVYYAAKAFTSIAAFRMATEEGLGVDVASGGELFAAMQAGVPRDDIIVHGNNKSDAELEMAVGAGVGRVAVDSIDELERLARVAEAAGVIQTIVLRVTPGVEAHTHDYIHTGQEDTEFGMSIESGGALGAAKRAADLPSVELVGAHAHIGSQIFGPEAFGKLVEIMLEYLGDVRGATGVALGELNVGGGLGIAYTKEE